MGAALQIAEGVWFKHFIDDRPRRLQVQRVDVVLLLPAMTHHQPLQSGLFTHQQMGGHMTFEASQDADQRDVSANTDGLERLARGARSAELRDNIGPAMTGDVLHRSARAGVVR